MSSPKKTRIVNELCIAVIITTHLTTYIQLHPLQPHIPAFYSIRVKTVLVLSFVALHQNCFKSFFQLEVIIEYMLAENERQIIVT